MHGGFEARNGRRTLALALMVALAVLAVPAIAGDVTSAVDLKLWGRAVFNIHHDTAILSQDFMSYITDDATEELNFNPRDTRLGFAATTREGDWTYKGVFEMDFYGDNAGNNLLPRLRLGYAEAAHANGLSIRGGQDWVPVAQQNPGTLDFGVQSWSGNLWWRVPQVTVRHRQQSVEVLASAMKHRVSVDQEMQETMPWLLGRVAVHDLVGEGSMLAVGGGFRSATIDSTDFSVDYTSHLLALEARVPVGETGIVVNGEAYVGQGVGREFVHYGFDYNTRHAGGGREIASKGGFVSAVVPVTPKIKVNAGYGLDDPDDDDLAGMTAAYLKNSTIFANFKYKVTPQFGWGLEAIHFVTDTGGADELSGQRFTGSWWFIF
jgi:hypothetical protein